METRLGNDCLVAAYDQTLSPLTYDFTAFASVAKAVAGSRPVHFLFIPGKDGRRSKPGKFHPIEEEFRFAHILQELAALYGTYSVCPDREYARQFNIEFPANYSLDNPVFDYHTDVLVRAVKDGIRLVAPQPTKYALGLVSEYLELKKSPVVTVTIRQTRNAVRNSSVEAWDKVMFERKDINWVLVPDTSRVGDRWGQVAFLPACVSQDIRLALYHLADLNCFTSNGCAWPLIGTDVPFLYFKAGGDGYMTKEQWKEMGIEYGTQPNFLSKRQKWIWAEDSVENISKEIATFFPST